MPSTRIPSPARSEGVKSTPRRYKSRASRSMGSPARSNSSVKLTAMIQMNSFALSPMPTRRSVLSDNTDIDMPRRKSWWKKLEENTQEILEELKNKEPTEALNAIEEYFDVDVLSQDKKNYTLDLPESSDSESIGSIVIPQKKLFPQKETNPQKYFAQIIDNRESLANLHRTQINYDKTINVGRKNLFSQGSKQRTKPIFPSALLNISGNKTIANKTTDMMTNGNKGQVKSLFGNRPDAKRRNMFTDFILSDSEDEIPEIQPKIFMFRNTPGQNPQQNLKSIGAHEPHLASPTSSITDIEMDDWRLLPSSTMVDHQLEDVLRATPSKKARLRKLSETTELIHSKNNTITNKSKQSNISKNISRKSKKEDNNIISPVTDNPELSKNSTINNKSGNKNKSAKRMNTPMKNISHEQNLKNQEFKNKQQSEIKNVSRTKIINPEADEVSNSEDVNIKSSMKSKSNMYNNSKKSSKIDQMLQSDDDEDFTLVYENDENDVQEPKESSKVTHNRTSENGSVVKQLQDKSKLHSDIHQTSENAINQQQDSLNNKSHKKIHRSINNTSISEKHRNATEKDNNEIEVDKIVANKQNNFEFHRVSNCQEVKRDIIDDQETCQDAENDEGPIGINNNTVNLDIDFSKENFQEKPKGSGVEEEEQSAHSNDHNIKQVEDNNIEEEVHDNKSDTEKEFEEEFVDSLNKEKEQNNYYQTIDIETKYDKDGNNDNQEVKDMIGNKTRNVEVEANKDKQSESNEVENKISYKNNDISGNKRKIYNEVRTNDTSKRIKVQHDTTISYKQMHDANVPSPEIVLTSHNIKTSQIESFTVQGRNTSMRKTKSIIDKLTIRPSIVPIRESTGISDGSRNSSVEGSGWDSHRTTRATLRQTFGKDFTPRKSLRALVMEKSAKRRTDLTEMNTEISRFPQANSTELPESEHSALDESEHKAFSNIDKSTDAKEIIESGQEVLRNIDKNNKDCKINETSHSAKIDKSEVAPNPNESNVAQEKSTSEDPQKIIESGHEGSREIVESDKEYKIIESSNLQSENAMKMNESDSAQEMDEYEDAEERNESGDIQENDESENEEEINKSDSVEKLDESEDTQEMEESENEQENNESEIVQDVEDSENAQKMNESDSAQEMNESKDAQEVNESEDAQEINESKDAQEMNESENVQEIIETENSLEIDESEDAPEMYESEDAQEMYESEDAQEMNESKDAQEMNESVNVQEIIETENALEMDEAVDAQEMYESEDAQEMYESEDAQEMNESKDAQEINESENVQEIIETENALKMDEAEDAQEMYESEDAQEMDESEDAQEINNYEMAQEKNDISRDKERVDLQKMEVSNENLRKTRQTTLEMYLQQVRKKNLQRKKQLEDEITKSLKVPTRDILNPFKVPAVPKLRRSKTQQTTPKAKKPKSSIITLDMLPDEVLEDMKYKPPKRYRPTNASWVTKRLYKFLETKLESKYDYKARVRAEKLVETIYNFTKDIRRHVTAPPNIVDALKHEMARLDIVKTHFEFYEFFHEFMPREVRVKVVPDVLNKISMPKHGVFSDIPL